MKFILHTFFLLIFFLSTNSVLVMADGPIGGCNWKNLKTGAAGTAAPGSSSPNGTGSVCSCSVPRIGGSSDGKLDCSWISKLTPPPPTRCEFKIPLPSNTSNIYNSSDFGYLFDFKTSSGPEDPIISGWSQINDPLNNNISKQGSDLNQDQDSYLHISGFTNSNLPIINENQGCFYQYSLYNKDGSPQNQWLPKIFGKEATNYHALVYPQSTKRGVDVLINWLPASGAQFYEFYIGESSTQLETNKTNAKIVEIIENNSSYIFGTGILPQSNTSPKPTFADYLKSKASGVPLATSGSTEKPTKVFWGVVPLDSSGSPLTGTKQVRYLYDNTFGQQTNYLSESLKRSHSYFYTSTGTGARIFKHENTSSAPSSTVLKIPKLPVNVGVSKYQMELSTDISGFTQDSTGNFTGTNCALDITNPFTPWGQRLSGTTTCPAAPVLDIVDENPSTTSIIEYSFKNNQGIQTFLNSFANNKIYYRVRAVKADGSPIMFSSAQFYDSGAFEVPTMPSSDISQKITWTGTTNQTYNLFVSKGEEKFEYFAPKIEKIVGDEGLVINEEKISPLKLRMYGLNKNEFTIEPLEWNSTYYVLIETIEKNKVVNAKKCSFTTPNVNLALTNYGQGLSGANTILGLPQTVSLAGGVQSPVQPGVLNCNTQATPVTKNPTVLQNIATAVTNTVKNATQAVKNIFNPSGKTTQTGTNKQAPVTVSYTFTWSAVKGAQSYNVNIYDSKNVKVGETIIVKVNSVNKDLALGSYSYEVSACKTTTGTNCGKFSAKKSFTVSQ